MRLQGQRLSRRGLVAIAVAGILLPTLVLTWLGIALVERHFRFQGRILEEYGRFSVEYAASEIQRAVTGEQRDIAALLQLVTLVEGFRPEFELGRVEAEHPLIDHAFLRRPGGTLVFAPIDTTPAARATRERARRLLQDVLDADTVRHVLLSGEVHFYSGQDSTAPYQVAAFPYRLARGAEAGVAGFFLDIAHLRRERIGTLLDTSIHAAEGRFAPDFGDVLTLVVRDEKDEEVYSHRHTPRQAGGSPAPCPTRDLARAALADVLPGWKVGITYADPSGFGWRRRIETLQLALLLLASGVVVAGTLVTTRIALRQMELSRLKSHLVSNITHELKTPLAAIRLYTETLQQGRVRQRAEADRFLEIIHKETARLTGLIDNILDFARIEDGRRRYRFAPAAIGAIVREIAADYGYPLENKGFALRLDIEDGLPLVAVDRDAIGQAVLNLLDNAVKYSRDAKTVTIAVRQDRGAAAGTNGRRAVIVEVRDRGVGIPAGEHRRIFEAFYRVAKGLEHDVKGSGLGLALVKHVAEAHGGTVEVESQPGTGSTFTLRLPVVEEA